MNTVLSQDMIDTIVEEARAGFSYALVAKRHGVPFDVVTTICRAQGLRARQGSPRIDRDAMQRAYDSGATDEDIADLCRCHAVTVRLWRNERGLPKNGVRTRLTARMVEKIAAKLEAGVSENRISRDLGVSLFRIDGIRRRRGLPKRTESDDR